MRPAGNTLATSVLDTATVAFLFQLKGHIINDHLEQISKSWFKCSKCDDGWFQTPKTLSIHKSRKHGTTTTITSKKVSYISKAG